MLLVGTLFPSPRAVKMPPSGSRKNSFFCGDSPLLITTNQNTIWFVKACQKEDDHTWEIPVHLPSMLLAGIERPYRTSLVVKQEQTLFKDLRRKKCAWNLNFKKNLKSSQREKINRNLDLKAMTDLPQG